MKNYIPLVLAVLLGFAAVVSVSRLLRERERVEETTVQVVVAARSIAADEPLTEDALARKEIPVSARPANAVPWARKDLIIGQKALIPIAESDYVLVPAIGYSQGMGTVVGVGEWAITLPASSGVGSVLRSGDEVAIIATFDVERPVESDDMNSEPELVSQDVTTVLFPRVRVLDIAGQGGGRGGTITVSLPPRDATVLIAAQRRADLVLALRRPGDDSNISRLAAGMVDDETFVRLLEGLETVKVDLAPGQTTREERP
jgi:Flp pilus assembly protein CpaB